MQPEKLSHDSKLNAPCQHLNSMLNAVALDNGGMLSFQDGNINNLVRLARIIRPNADHSLVEVSCGRRSSSLLPLLACTNLVAVPVLVSLVLALHQAKELPEESAHKMCPHMQAATQNQASPKILGSTSASVFILEQVRCSLPDAFPSCSVSVSP